MNKEELLEQIKMGEGYSLEFKESVSSSLGKGICAFANASGGKIILGVRAGGEIKGVSMSDSVRSQIQDIARNMDPPFYVTIELVDDLAVIYVPEGKEKPYAVGGHFYLRQGSNSQQLRRDEIRAFFQRENQIRFDRKSNTEFDMGADFNGAVFELFKERADIEKSLPREHILKNLNLMTEDRLNNAGVLFFCQKVSKFFMNAAIACALYGGKTKTNILDKKEFDGDFISNYNDAVNYVLSKLNTGFEIKSRERVELPEIPEEVLREIIINAMTHRDYFSEGRVQIDIFSDRLEVSNPGNLLFKRSDLGKISLSRNPLLVDLAHRLRFVERLGSGIHRIQEMMKDKVAFEVSSDWFRVTLLRNAPTGGQISGQMGGQILTEKQQEILKIIFERPRISRKELAVELNINPSAVQKHISKLKEKGLLKRVGPDKGGHWEVTG